MQRESVLHIFMRYAIKLVEHIRCCMKGKTLSDLKKWEISAMSLYESQPGKYYEIQGLHVEEGITRRLQALGLNDGTQICVLNRKKHGAVIIRVRGTRLAIGKYISSGIEITEIGHE